MAQLGVKCPRGYISWQECLGTCAHDPLRPCDYTPDLLMMLRTGEQGGSHEPGAEAFTPSRLLGCSRYPVLVGETDHYVDIDQAYPSTRGNMVHALMESAQYPGAIEVIREQRLGVKVNTKYGLQEFTAKPDLIVVKEITEDKVLKVKVVDYKSIVKVDNTLIAAKLEHQLQVNMYAWIVEHTLADHLGFLDRFQVDVDELEILYCAMDNKRRFTDAGPRQVPCRRKVNGRLVDALLDLEPIRHWDSAKVGRYVQAKITERLDAQHVKLPDILEGEQAWLCRYCAVRDFCHSVGNIPQEDNDVQVPADD